MKIKNIQEIKNKRIVLGRKELSFEDVVSVSRYNAFVEFDDFYIDRVNKSTEVLDRLIKENRKIYGVNTGFGKNVKYLINKTDAKKLQKNIVRSHAVSVGGLLSEEKVRAIMFMMLVNTGKGYSGIRIETLELIKNMLNERITPCVPGEGSVAYLSIEAHIALTFIGEGTAKIDNEILSGIEALRKKRLEPIELTYKEGLSLLNGSMTVCGIGSLAIYDLIICMETNYYSTALTFEALKGIKNHFDSKIHLVKKHEEQIKVAKKFRQLLNGSEILEKYKNSKIQDPYVLRSTSQILGASKKIIDEAQEVLDNEINSVSDNPIIFSDKYGDSFSMCGNFDASFLTIYFDSAALGACNIAKLADKRIDRLVSEDLSELPGFLIENPGLNNGFMIAQYTVAGLFSEISNLSTPVSLQSISTCSRQEEPVSLGVLASEKLYNIAHKLKYIVSIELIMACQALEFLKPLKSSKINLKVYNKIREVVEFMEEDRFIESDIEKVFNMVEKGIFIEISNKLTD